MSATAINYYCCYYYIFLRIKIASPYYKFIVYLLHSNAETIDSGIHVVSAVYKKYSCVGGV